MIHKVKRIKKKYIVLFLIFILVLITPFTYSKYTSKHTKRTVISAIQSGYVVEFNANGGDGEMKAQSFAHGTPQELYESSFTREGFVFLNWNTEPDGTGTSYEDRGMIEEDLTTENGGIVTLYAIYAREKYSRTGDFICNGANYIDTNIYLFNEENVNKDFEVSFEIKNRDGNANTGYLTNDYPTIMSAMSEAGRPWPGMVYRIYNQYDDQLIFTADASQPVNFDKSNYHLPADKQKVTLKRINGTIYVNINDADDVQLLDASSMQKTFDYPVVFCASLDSNKHPQRYFAGTLSNLKVVVTDPKTEIGTIRFEPTGADGEDNKNYAQHISPNTPSKLMKNRYTRTGYLFDGWVDVTTGNKYQDEEEVTLTSGQVLSLRAQWKEYKYMVNFDANGGNGNMDPQELHGGSSETLNKSSFTRDDGLTFAFWNTERNGSGITYQDEQSVKNLSANTGPVTLYAIYEQFSFEQAGSTTFDGIDDYIDTHIYLFSEKNVNKNFEISFEITSYENTHNYNTFVSSLDESDKPYPGFVFRINDSSTENFDVNTLDYIFEANSSTSKESNVKYSLDKVINKVVIKRVDGVLYFKRDGNAEERKIDYATLARRFYYPVTIGASLDKDFNPWRHFKGTLSNIKITLSESSESTGEQTESVEEEQNN